MVETRKTMMEALQLLSTNLERTFPDFKAMGERLNPTNDKGRSQSLNCHLSAECARQHTADLNHEKLATFTLLDSLEAADRNGDAQFNAQELKVAWDFLRNRYAQLMKLCPPPDEAAREAGFFNCIGAFRAKHRNTDNTR